MRRRRSPWITTLTPRGWVAIAILCAVLAAEVLIAAIAASPK